MAKKKRKTIESEDTQLLDKLAVAVVALQEYADEDSDIEETDDGVDDDDQLDEVVLTHPLYCAIEHLEAMYPGKRLPEEVRDMWAMVLRASRARKYLQARATAGWLLEWAEKQSALEVRRIRTCNFERAHSH